MSEKSSRISEPLKKEVEQHEQHLKRISSDILHANTHLVALSDIAQRLKFHIELQKTKSEDVTTKNKMEDKDIADAPNNVFFFNFSDNKLSNKDFFSMVQSLVEGILLIGTEINLGRIAKELQGHVIQNDLGNWKEVITILQKYDDQVRRAVEFYDRQYPQE